jgi:K(+)-stimulated pyrophosphate-energized sodium pump
LRRLLPLLAVLTAVLLAPASAMASEADLVLPDLGDENLFEFAGMSGKTLLTLGLAVAALGIVFGLVIYVQLKRLPVHRSMAEV